MNDDKIADRLMLIASILIIPPLLIVLIASILLIPLLLIQGAYFLTSVMSFIGYILGIIELELVAIYVLFIFPILLKKAI